MIFFHPTIDEASLSFRNWLYKSKLQLGKIPENFTLKKKPKMGFEKSPP